MKKSKILIVFLCLVMLLSVVFLPACNSEPDPQDPPVNDNNNDGKNDIVFVKGEWIESFEFEIFDRWGESVFFTNNLSEGWDGTFNGKLCDAAVYFYRLVVNCAGGKKFVEGGDITLIR